MSVGVSVGVSVEGCVWGMQCVLLYYNNRHPLHSPFSSSSPPSLLPSSPPILLVLLFFGDLKESIKRLKICNVVDPLCAEREKKP